MGNAGQPNNSPDQIHPIAVATATDPTFSEGFRGFMSMDLAGYVRDLAGKILSSVWNQVTGALTVNIQPITSGGLSTSRTLSANNTTGIAVKASTGQLYGWAITNTNASPRFVKIYNNSAPTVGTTTPQITLMIPGNSSGAGMVAAEFTSGISFATAIGLGITTGVADNDTGAPAANEVVVNLFYK